MAGTITDFTAVEPAFVAERFELAGGRLEIAGHWSGLRGRRFVRPVLWLHQGEARRRIVAVLDHKPWAVEDNGPWIAAFDWSGGPFEAERAELEVGRELVVELPVPGAEPAEDPRPARARRPTEVERLRAELLAAREEARDTARLQAALDRAQAEGDALRRELTAAREDADRARADGERLVNDEYEQRRRALEAAEAATARAREAREGHDLARRQLAAARESYAKLEQRLASVEGERDALAADERPTDERLGERLAAVEAERDRASERLAAVEAERVALAERLAAADERRTDERSDERVVAVAAERDRASQRLAAAEAERERVAAQLEAARGERDRAREELAAVPARVADVEAERDRLGRRLAAAEEQRDHARARLAAAEAEGDGLRNELVAAVAPPVRRPLVEPASPIGPPESGPGLWIVRILALALVAVLLAAAGLVLGGVL